MSIRASCLVRDIWLSAVRQQLDDGAVLVFEPAGQHTLQIDIRVMSIQLG